MISLAVATLCLCCNTPPIHSGVRVQQVRRTTRETQYGATDIRSGEKNPMSSLVWWHHMYSTSRNTTHPLRNKNSLGDEGKTWWWRMLVQWDCSRVSMVASIQHSILLCRLSRVQATSLRHVPNPSIRSTTPAQWCILALSRTRMLRGPGYGLVRDS
jgi:hypothetical protein